MRALLVGITIVGCTRSTPSDRDRVAPPPPPSTTTVVLAARGKDCTELACSQDSPCCNTCRLEGWWPPGAASAAMGVRVAPGTAALPDVTLDSCNKAPFAIEAQVVTEGQDLVVHSWKRIPPP